VSTKQRSLGDILQEFSQHRQIMQQELQKVIIGQTEVIEQLFAAIFTRGHCLLEGVPGLAKTLMVSTLARILELDFNRIQFTPDLMPSDIVGTNVLEEDDSGRRSFRFVKGPIFSNIVLADEINRTPPKTQAALLQAMQEREVTVGGKTYPLPEPFFVIATQNPIEQEGTYPLPEAQLDRFLLKVVVGYPDRGEEKEIIARMAKNAPRPAASQVASLDQLSRARVLMDSVYMDDRLVDYIIDLVVATRDPKAAGLKSAQYLIAHGVSPRGSVALTQCSRALALIRGRAFVTPQDVKSVAMDVFRHRIIVTYEAEAEGIASEDLITQLLDTIPVP